MAFTFNGVTPTSIVYNGTALTVLKYGTTAVWGKPYTLSISQGSNTTVTVNRTSSPNMRASTGTLANGSLVYHGDVLTISFSASSGYNLTTSTVNGNSFTSGGSHTVSGNVSIVTASTLSATWHTVWTGSIRIGGMQNVGSTSSVTYTKANGDFGTGVDFSRPTKLTGSVETTPIGNVSQYSNVQIGTEVLYQTELSTVSTGSGTSSSPRYSVTGTAYANGSLVLKISMSRVPSSTVTTIRSGYINITSVTQYY